MRRCAQSTPARLRDSYDAELATLDFRTPDAVSGINTWISKKTKGKISHIVDVLSPLTAIFAVNAIYFKGRWTRPFDRELTHDELFTTATGQRKHLPMMCQSGRYSDREDRNSQLEVLPYEGGTAMYLMLPAARTNLRRFQSGLTSGAWESRLGGQALAAAPNQ